MKNDVIELITKQMEMDTEAMCNMAMMDMSVTDFSQIQSMMDVNQNFEDIQNLILTLRWVVMNIDCTITDPQEKVTAVKKAVDDFNSMLADLTSGDATKQKNVTEFISGLFSKSGKFKTEDGVKYSASDYAYVPDPEKPSTWKLRMSEEKPGNVTISQLSKAAQALSSSGFMGNQVKMPNSSKAGAKAKIHAEYKKLGVSDNEIPASVKENKNFTLTKDANDNLRFLVIYSNNFRDVDNPPEIISSKSHKDFVERVEKGISQYPELWHWHIKGTRWGKADWLYFDEETGMAYASGTIDPGHEEEAYALANTDKEIRLSHGMPVDSIEYDQKDKSVIVRHDTVEISDLPEYAAANPLTAFQVIIPKEEKEVAIPKNKKEYLLSMGVSEETILGIESVGEKAAKEAHEQGIDSKEVTSPVETTEAVTTEAVAPVVPVETSTETPTAENKEANPGVVTKEEMKQAFQEVISVFADQLKSIAELQGEFKTRLDALESKSISTEELSPTGGFLGSMLKSLSVIGSPETIVDRRSTLGKSEPTQAKVTSAPASGEDILGSVIGNLIGAK